MPSPSLVSLPCYSAMELLRKAKEFCDFLVSASDSSERLIVYGEEYAVVVLSAGTATPFDDFTGQLEGTTLLFSKYQPASSPDNEAGQSTLDCSPSSMEGSVREQCEPLAVGHRFPALSYQTVNVGQPLSQKRYYLTQSAPLHSGHTEDLVTEQTVAYDAGVTPLHLDKARYITSLYALGSRQTESPHLPNIWVVCKDEKRSIVALGCSCNNVVDGKRSLQSFVVTVEDILPESQLAGQEKNTAHLAKTKLKVLSGGDGSFAFSEYEIANYSTDVVNREEKLAGDLTVQFAWSGPEALLSPPPESADAVVKISATPGYAFSPVLASYSELNTLLHLCEIASGKADWPSLSEDIDNESIVQSSTKPLSGMIGSFLEEVSSPLAQLPEVTVISPTSENTVYEPRKDLDFAERLWLFAKDATSLGDLQQVFAEVFKAVLLGRVQPFIHRSSSSILASLLRKVLLAPNMDEKQDLAPKFQNLLTESKICPCLVQLGVEKMMRDYRAFFIGADVATGDQLDQFISKSRGSQLVQCHALCSLHCILELMSSALSFLKLPAPTLSALFKSALEVYREKTFERFSTTPVFSLPLPAYSTAQKSLVSFCSSLVPKKWVLSRRVGLDKATVQLYKNQPLLTNLPEIELGEGRYYAYKACYDCL